MNDELAFFEDEEEYPLKKKAGRPLGRKNFDQNEMGRAALTSLFNRIQSRLTPEHQEYLRRILTGKTEIDPKMEMQLLIRYLTVLSFESAEWAIEAKKIPQELPKLLGEHRQALNDLDAMNRRDRDEATRRANDERFVDATRHSNLSRLLEDD